MYELEMSLSINTANGANVYSDFTFSGDIQMIDSLEEFEEMFKELYTNLRKKLEE